MVIFEVGKAIPEFIGRGEGAYFDIDESGITVNIFFKSPTEKEIEQFSSDKPFTIRYTELSDVIMVLLKVGTLNWIDAPYSPHLSKLNSNFSDCIPDGKGYSLTLMLVDCNTGIPKHIRYIGLNTRFSRELQKSVLAQLEKPFNKERYQNSFNAIFSKYTTKDLVKLSSHYCGV